jgi:hypothetical protein
MAFLSKRRIKNPYQKDSQIGIKNHPFLSEK